MAKGLTNSYERAKYSFSGADAKAYFVTERKEDKENKISKGFDLTPVESLSTVSVQTYEPVGRARALGFRGIVGFAHSVREIAGTMILTVVNDHPLRPLMSKSLKGIRRSNDKNRGFGSMAAGDDLFAAVGENADAIVQEATSIATLLGDFGLFIDYVSEYPKYDADFIPNFKLGDQTSQVDTPVVNSGLIDRDGNGFYDPDYQRTNFYEEMFTDRYLRLREEYLKGEGNRSYGGMFSHYGEDYSKMNRSFENPKGSGVLYNTAFEPGSGNLLVTEDFREEFEKSISQNPQFLKKEYRDDLDRLINPHIIHGFYYDPKIATRQNERAGLYIEGIRIISEGIVTSVNDMVTEMTFQFIAKDLKTISKLNNFENPALREEELAAILNNEKTRPVQMQLEFERLQRERPELRDMITYSHIKDDGQVETLIVADSGTEWKQTTKKQRRKMYGKKKEK